MWAQSKLFLLALVLIPLFDFVWLGLLMKSFYLAELSEIGRILNGRFDVQFGAAFAVYIFLALGIVSFVLPGATDVVQALLRGGFFGLLTYGVYDMTNMAVLRNYGLKLSLVDMAWGTVLCGSISAIIYLLRTKEML